jgi:glycosyltransferase involved in cell wall biosynthesis
MTGSVKPRRPSRVSVVSFATTAASTAGQAEWIARRCPVTILQPERWPWYAAEQTPDIPGAQIIRLPVWFPGHHHFHVYRRLGAALRRASPDLLYIDQEPWTVSTVQAARVAAQLPCAVVCFTWQNLFKRYPPPFPWLEAWVHRHATMIIAGNDEAAGVLRRRGYKGLVRVVPQFGVDPGIFRPSPSTKAELGLPGDSLVVGFIGRLVHEKGLVTALRAVAGIPEAHLALAGIGPAEQELKALAATLGVGDRVHFLGGFPSRRIPEVLAGIDALILPSRTTQRWKEQFGRVLIEAMAAEVPVVGSTSGEIPKVIGDAGLVFREGDVDDCARCIRSLLDPSRRTELATLGAARVRAHFTQERIAGQLWDAWCEAFDAWLPASLSP